MTTSHIKHLNVLVLSAKPLSLDLQNETGAFDPVGLSVGPDLLLWLNFKAIRTAVGPDVFVHMCVIVSADSPSYCGDQSRFKFHLEDRKVALEVFVVPDPRTFLDTMACAETAMAHHNVFARGGDTLVIPGDTLFDEGAIRRLLFAPRTPGVTRRLLCLPYTKELSQFPELNSTASRWTVIGQIPGRKRVDVYDRSGLTKERLEASGSILSFYSGACHFLKGFSTFLKSLPNGVQDPSYFNQLFNGGKVSEVISVDEGVHDFGHLDTYWSSRFNHLSARVFNKITFDARTSTLTKTSTSDTFDDQCEWFNTAEQHDWLRPYLPLAMSYKNKLTMEALPILPLSEAMFNESFTEFHWSVAAVKLVDLLANLNGRTKLTSKGWGTEVFGKKCAQMLLIKTITRLEKFLAENETKTICRMKFFTHHGHRTLQDVQRDLTKYMHLTGVHLAPSYGQTFMHGDLCFSNILFDRRTLALKIIDPRGRFGDDGRPEYGDLAYDIAKLKHSYRAGYDLVLSRSRRLIDYKGTYGLSHGAQSPGASHFSVEMERLLTEAVNSRRLPKTMLKRSDYMMPLLFVSMLPLHQEDNYRVTALAAIAVKEFYTILDRLDGKPDVADIVPYQPMFNQRGLTT